MTTKELFITRVDQHWESLKGRDDTIFENVGIQLNSDDEFKKFKASDAYLAVMHESGVYDKKRLIESYFWGEIVGDLYENTINIMKQANLLEESLESSERHLANYVHHCWLL